MKEAALGLVPDLTGTKPLVDLVGHSRALDICATARRVSAFEAAALGLATVVAPAAGLPLATAELAGAILANDVAAVRATAELLGVAARNDLDTQRRLERQAQVARFRTLLLD